MADEYGLLAGAITINEEAAAGIVIFHGTFLGHPLPAGDRCPFISWRVDLRLKKTSWRKDAKSRSTAYQGLRYTDYRKNASGKTLASQAKLRSSRLLRRERIQRANTA